MSDDDHQMKVDHDQLVETTARLTELVSGSKVTRLKLSVGPYEWDIEAAPPVVQQVATVAVPAGGAVLAPAAEAAVVAEPAAPAGHPVTAPLVGVFYRSPAPNAAPFVEPGQQVAEGDQLAIVEAMKMMNAVTAPRAGVVREVHADDGAIVEFGELLITLDPI